MGKFSWDLAVNKTWIKNGGTAWPMTVEATVIALPMLPRPQAMSEGESEVSTSNLELPSPLWVVPKVWLLDDMEHVLNKCAWAETPAVCQSGRFLLGYIADL